MFQLLHFKKLIMIYYILLSIPSKVFCKVLLGRIQTAIDKELRQEQAVFRKKGGYTNQIFALRNSIEQTLEWDCPLYINFIDSNNKNLDIIYLYTQWMISRSYGIPPKIVSLTEKFYNHFECSVILRNAFSEWFPEKFGVRQGYILSPILFVVINRIMRETITDTPRGIQWILVSQLENFDFADDLAFLTVMLGHLQETTERFRQLCNASWANLQYNQNKSNEYQYHTNCNCYP